MKKVLSILLSVLLVCGLAFTFFACRTSAIWRSQNQETSNTSSEVGKVNGSEKYIVYAALDESGNLIASGSATETVAYAVVGYTGLVAELTIPAEYDDKPVTKVLVATPYASYKCYMDGAAYTGDDARLANQTVVKSIVFGANVSFVGAGVCAEMINLTSVRFVKAQADVTHTNAFLGISPQITYGD